MLVILAAHPSRGQQNMLMETLPPEWQEDDFFVETTPDDDFWWKKFEDTLLDSLITIATERNLSAMTALTNIRIAKAGWRMTQSGLLPSLSLSTGWTREKASGNLSQTGDAEAWYGYFSGAISMNWEVDVFGKIFKRAQAQKRAFQATEEEYRATMVTLCAEVANAYFSLRQCQAEMGVLRENAQSQKEIMEIFRELANQGKCVILVSHSPDVAEMCDERYELVKISGKKKRIKPKEVKDKAEETDEK